MTRFIKLTLSRFNKQIDAALLDEHEPEFAEHLWQRLETPMRMWSWHPMLTGDWFACKARPETSKPLSGANEPKSHSPDSGRLMCDIEAGSIIYAADRMLRFAYGPKITEPLAGMRPVVARALDLDTLYAAGRHVLKAHFETHELVTVTASRKEA